MNTPKVKEPAAAPSNESVSDVTTESTPWYGKLGQWNIEIAALYGKRFQEWSTMPLRLLQCQSMDDLLDQHEEFSQRLMTDYGAAAAKLAGAFGSSAEGPEQYAATLLKAQQDAARILDQAKAQARQIIEAAEARSEVPEASPDSAKAA
jgi:hypothetical protein